MNRDSVVGLKVWYHTWILNRGITLFSKIVYGDSNMGKLSDIRKPNRSGDPVLIELNERAFAAAKERIAQCIEKRKKERYQLLKEFYEGPLSDLEMR